MIVIYLESGRWLARGMDKHAIAPTRIDAFRAWTAQL